MKLVALAAIAVVLAACLPVAARAAETSKKYRALAVTSASGASAGTWAVLDRDGANRDVGPYLSSLGGGEQGTGTIASPAFVLSVEKVTFTICGHDGDPGAPPQGKCWIALVDAADGKALRKEAAPRSDSFAERSWDVKDLKGRKVRIEVRDGLDAGAFAWMGIGRIDAGPEMKVEFRSLPAGWKAAADPASPPKAPVFAGNWIPFRDAVNTIVPNAGAAKLPCGFEAKRLFFLGCTVEYGRPPDRRGEIAIVYADGSVDRISLIVGWTLECENKVLSRAPGMRLRSAGEPFLYVLPVKPKAAKIVRIELTRDPAQPGAVSIRGITVETSDSAPTLLDLPAVEPKAEDASWIESVAGK
jgi:hypothetical protein